MGSAGRWFVFVCPDTIGLLQAFLGDYRGGGGGLGQAKFGMAKFGVDKIWYEFLNSMAKFGAKLLDCGQGKITTPEIEPPRYQLLTLCLTNSPTSTTCLTCIKLG